MLSALRQSAGSWVVKIFLGLLVLSFAVWGIGDIFRLQPDAAVVTVGETEVSGYQFLNDFNRQVRRMQATLGPTFDTEQARQLGVVDQVLQQSISRALYDQEVANLELTMSDQDIANWIRQSSAFRNSFGQFDPLLFEQRLAENGFTEQRYIAASRQDLSREQLFSSITGGAKAPSALVKTYYQFQQETRLFEVLSLPYDKVKGIAEPNEADLKAYHEANKDHFMAPEFRTVSYLTLRPEDLLEEILATDGEIADAYEARLNEFTVQPTRELEQIVVSDEAEAQKIAGRLKDGGDFYVVAQELAGMDKESVTLGVMTKADLPDSAGDPVFALSSGQISEPIESDLGWHIFRVLKAVEGGSKSLAEVREQIARDVRLEKATDAMFELANQVEDQLAGGSSIREIAEALNLNHGVITALDRQGRGQDGQPAAGLPKAPEFSQEAFSLQPGDEGELKESGDGSYYLVQVDKITESTLKPLSQVRDDVRKAVVAERRAKAAAEQAGKIAVEARTGKPLMELTVADSSTFTNLQAMTRSQAAGEAKLGAELVEKLFKLRGGDVAEGAASDGKSHSVVRLVSITRPDPNSDPALLRQLDEAVRASIVNDVLAQYRAALQGKYDVEINDRIIDALFDEANVRG